MHAVGVTFSLRRNFKIEGNVRAFRFVVDIIAAVSASFRSTVQGEMDTVQKSAFPAARIPENTKYAARNQRVKIYFRSNDTQQ